jgi:hypothetical protein
MEIGSEYEFLTGAEKWYGDYVVEQSITAIKKAHENMQEVWIGYGSGIVDKIAFNRRGVKKGGKVTMPWFYSSQRQPYGPVEIKYLEGPNDPEAAILCARSEDMSIIGMLMNFTCHPVNVFAKKHTHNAVSSDWPGAWSEKMMKTAGVDCFPTVINGCCGNINPFDPFGADVEPDHRRMGEELKNMTEKILFGLRFDNNDILESKSLKINLNYREVPQKRLEEVESILSSKKGIEKTEDGNFKVDEDWIYAVYTKNIELCRKRMPEFDYEIQVFRIGDVAIVGLPGEPFVEGQLEIKVKSPANLTLFAHCVSSYAGYIPTEDAFKHEGHETHSKYTFWSKLAPDSLQKIVDSTIEILNTMFDK